LPQALLSPCLLALWGHIHQDLQAEQQQLPIKLKKKGGNKG